MTTPSLPNIAPQHLLTVLPDRDTACSLLNSIDKSELKAINHRVFSTTIDGELHYIKLYRNTKPLKELKIRLGLLKHEALMEFHAFKLIERLGITTITPTAAVSYKQDRYQESLIISKDFNQNHYGYSSLKSIAKSAPEQCENLLKQLSELIVKLLKNNIFYLDIHLENFLSNGNDIAIMDAEGTFQCPKREISLCAKFLDMSARNLCNDLKELNVDIQILSRYFQPILKELGLTHAETYQLLWKRQKRKHMDMRLRLLRGKITRNELAIYAHPLPHLTLFSDN